MSEQWQNTRKLPPLFDANMGGEIPEDCEAADVEGCEVKIRATVKASDVEKARRETYVEALKSGLTPTQAADVAQTSTKEMNRDPMVTEAVTKLLQDFAFSKEQLKALGRARMAKVLLTGRDNDAVAAKKALDAEDGPKSGNVTAVQINVSQDTKAKIDSADFTIPGLE